MKQNVFDSRTLTEVTLRQKKWPLLNRS